MEEVSEASQQGVQTKEAPGGRACRVTPTASLPSHLDDLYQRTASCLEETQKVEVAALLAELADVFAHSADDLGRTSIVGHEICTNDGSLSVKTPDVYPLVNEQWPRQK